MNKLLPSGAGPRKLRWSLRCWLALGAALAAPGAFASDAVGGGMASCQTGPRATEPVHPALVSTERRLNAICARDVPTVLSLIDLEDPRIMGFPEGPRWVTNKGETIRRGWNDYMDNPVVLKNWSWVQGPDVKAEGTMALVAAVVNYEFEVNGRPNPLKMRMTWVLHEVDGVWKSIHEHGSQPLPDPYGFGDWLRGTPPEGDAAWAGERPPQP